MKICGFQTLPDYIDIHIHIYVAKSRSCTFLRNGGVTQGCTKVVPYDCLTISGNDYGSCSWEMTQRNCAPPLSMRRRVVARGWLCRGATLLPRHITLYRITPAVKGVETWLGRIAQNAGALASRRPSSGVSQAGRCLVPAPFRHGTRNRTVYVRRDGASVRSSISPSSGLRFRYPIQNRARLLFAPGRASDALLWTTTTRAARSKKARTVGSTRAEETER